ncbi:MAG: rRNA methyltransferase [Ruminiclostridium sp.]|nr:rRNA methyltransferase [Ruminiclostridium sp.]
MELPVEFKNVTEGLTDHIPLKKLIAASNAISERYRTESGTGKPLITNETEATAYAIVRMPATIGAVMSAMTYAAEHFDSEINTMLDIGAGTGACCWAGMEIFPEIENITCLEREKAMLDFGKKLMAEGDFPSECEWVSHDITKAFNCKADLVTASYVMNELTADKRESLTQRLWTYTEKLLIIIEPGTPVGFENIRAIRRQLIDMGAKIIAPCPHNEDCPITENDWCHFTARVSRTKLHKQLKGGDVPYEDEKFCYIAATRENYGQCSARVLRHPKIESGKITLKLCTADGISEKIVTKKDGALFKKARKSSSGDEI